MRIWGLVSQKGGVGKTTIGAHLAVYAHQCGEKVLVIDLDPQESARKWHMKRGESTETPAVLSVVADNLTKVLDAARTLGVTLVIIDTPGKIDNSALAAIRAADLIITPTQPNFFDIEGLKDTVDLIGRVGKIGQAVCVVNGLAHQSVDQDFADAQLQAEAVGISVSPAFLVHRRAYQVSLREGKGVTEYKPKDAKAIREIEALWSHVNAVAPIGTKEKANQ